MKKVFLNCMLLLCALIVGSNVVWADDPETLYYETFGTTGNKTNVSDYTGFSSSVITPTSSGWKISDTSTATCDKTGTSGSCNAYCGSTSDIIFNFGDKFSEYSSVKLSFNYNKGSGNGKANTLKLYLSGNGGSTYGSDILPSNTGTSGTWYSVTDITIPAANLANLCIKFSTSTNTNRLDDIKITGIFEAPAAPTVDVPEGEFNAAFDLTITGSAGTTLKYTTDGTDPTSSVTATTTLTNSATITIPTSTTRVRAIAVKSGHNSSETDVTYTYSSKEEPTFSLSPSPMSLKVGASGTLTLTTTSDGDVTFACDDDHVTLTGSGNSRTVSANAEGNYTINVSVAATTTYISKAGSVTLNVTKYATTTTIISTGITNTDIGSSTVAGTLSATVTPEGQSALASPTISWTSSKTGVATVASDGAVTLVGIGTTTITASYAGDATYSASSKTYSLTVTDSRTYFTWDLSTNSSVSATTELVTWADDYATMTLAKGSSGTAANNYLASSDAHTRMYKDQVLKISPVPGYSIIKAEITAVSSYVAGFTGNTWTNASKSTSGTLVSITPTNGKNAFYVTISAACRATAVKVYYEDADEAVVTITAATWASFSCASALDFTGTGVTAYIAKAKDGESVILSPISKVPANTGIVVNAAAGTYAIPVLSVDADDVTGNLLHAWLTAGTPSEDSYYTLAIDNNTDKNPVFKKSSGGVLAAGKAYLVPSGEMSAPSIIRVVDEENNATSIENIEANEKAVKFIENGRILILRDGITYDALGRIVK